jgi:chromosome segregation ATPase
VDVCIKDVSTPKADCSAAEKKAKDAEAQRDSANKEITDLENKKKKIEDKRDEFKRLYDKALKRINNPIDGDPSGLNAQIEQLKQSATSAKSQYEKNSAVAEARRLAEIKREQEKAAGAAEVAGIKLSEEIAATDSALEQARKAKRKAEMERRQYMELRKRLEARINQLNAQQGKSNEELFAALDKINELKQISLDERSID